MAPLGKKNRNYDQKFKEAAVEMYLTGHRSARAVAQDLGICRRSLQIWVKELSPTGKPLPQSPAQVQRDLRTARTELQSIRTQCEILKKTIAILSERPNVAKE
jgi:transposase-like protein